MQTAESWQRFCACPGCFEPLLNRGGPHCPACSQSYPLRGGVPILLPLHQDPLRSRYFDCYLEIARDDLQRPLEALRSERNQMLLEFLGNPKGRTILDIGSSYGLLASQLHPSNTVVCLDLVVDYLEARPDPRIQAVCGDAEHLPLQPGKFDIIILSGVLEHFLDPRAAVAQVARIARPDTRVVVLLPWRENLGQYIGCQYEFSHLRSFDSYDVFTLFYQFNSVKTRKFYPSLEHPILFRLEPLLGRWLFNLLSRRYYYTDASTQEYRWREKLIQQLPQAPWWVWLFYEAKFRMFEFRLRQTPRQRLSRLLRKLPL